ncbi:MAG: T9SS type A sorting domain-containing protein [Flavobacteriales bacterium]|nr:T9SS type A sorting domain-containing protein [Flavobacteriales bacterium]
MTTKSTILTLSFLISTHLVFSQQVQMVTDHYPGEVSSEPNNLLEFEDELYFSSIEPSTGRELRKIDGGSTIQTVFDAYTGPWNGEAEHLIEQNGLLMFSVDTGTGFTSVWQFDGINTSIHPLSQSMTFSIPLVAHDGFYYYKGIGQTTLYELKGVSGQTVQHLSNLPSGLDEGAIGSTQFGLTFASDNGSSGQEPYVFDGFGINSMGDNHPGQGDSDPVWFTDFNGEVYYSSNDGFSGNELWKYDGQSSQMVADIVVGGAGSYPNDLTVLDTVLCFRASDGGFPLPQNNLFKWNGQTLTTIIENIGQEDMMKYDDRLYFVTDDPTYGWELFSYDGATVSLVHDIHPTGNSNPQDLVVIDDKLYFSAANGSNGRELWVHDGLNTMMVADINPTGDSNPKHMTEAGGFVYFSADDGTSGAELWKLDPNSIPTSVEDNPSSKQLMVYPNPSAGKFSFSNDRVSKSEGFIVYNSLGEQIMTGNTGFGSVALENQPSGIYIIVVSSTEGRLSAKLTNL